MPQASEARFRDEAAIREYLERIRWPNGPVCPFCGTVNHAYRIAKAPGLYRCGRADCCKDFNVKSRTIFEGTHIPLNKWLLATRLMLSGHEAISPRQFENILGFTNYWSALSFLRRIRKALPPVRKRRVLKDAIRHLLNTPAKHHPRRPVSSKKRRTRRAKKMGRSEHQPPRR